VIVVSFAPSLNLLYYQAGLILSIFSTCLQKRLSFIL
jgi:hypothetical protein